MLQRATPVVKRRWLVGTTAIAMVVIISAWMMYLKTAIPTTGIATQQIEIKKDSFFTTLWRGAGVVYNNIETFITNTVVRIGSGVGSLSSFVGSSRSFTIEKGVPHTTSSHLFNQVEETQ